MFGTGIELLLYAIWMLEGEMVSPLLLNLNLNLSPSELFKSSTQKLKRKPAQPPTSYWTFSVCAHLGHLSVYTSMKPPLWSLTVRRAAGSINHPLQIFSTLQVCMLDLAWAAPQMRKTGQALSFSTELLPAPQKHPVRLSRTWRNSRLQLSIHTLHSGLMIDGGELCGGVFWVVDVGLTRL